MAKIKNLLTVILCASSLLLFSQSNPVFAQTVVDTLGTIKGEAVAINNNGYVLIIEQTGDTMTNDLKFNAGIWNSSIDDYQALPETYTNDPFTTTNELNDSLVFVGNNYDNNTYSYRAFTYDTISGYQSLDASLSAHLGIQLAESQATAVNNKNQVVGSFRRQDEWTNHMYIYDMNTASFTIVDDSLLSFSNISPTDINNNGVIVGALDGSGFIYSMTTNTFTVLTEANHSSISPQSINDTGLIVGKSQNISNGYQSEGFVLSESNPTLFTFIAPLGIAPSGSTAQTGTSANSVNNSGQIVGLSSAADGYFHAYLREGNGQMIDLGLVDLSATGSEALSINDIGYIVGWNSTSDPALAPYYPVIWDYVITKSNNGKRIRKNRDKKLTPTPEPSPAAMGSLSVSSKKNGK